ncbi:flagellar basal body P-ring formation chaperone FlgA [Silvimonas iriomotensis]|uniref:Flagella basal body P-ring formation protein FlgA n=1 Tax=Silvimonas iriomotensis TaxID=449662 RepID=A0ABQ2P670_9NEIS|nr:flagellar basal body P-ring formation chaperone FlgA [Silvimonas iriomotensis]GGP19106.1 flagellar basal body P-ring biosynthesis protein FlgA [Silvimonas iriomotensis]
MRTLLVSFGFLLAVPALAAGQVDLATVQRNAASWLDQQLSQYQGQSSYSFGKLDSRLRLDACNAMDVKAAPGYRLAGNSMLRVTCVDGATWAVNLPVKISVQATYYVAAKPLAAGHQLADGDLAPQQGDLGQLPGSVILDPANALGRTLSTAVAAGGAVRSEMLRAPIIIQQGQKVRVLMRVGEIEVSNDGYAMNNASEGQNVRVRVGTSTIVQGIARADGAVLVTE